MKSDEYEKRHENHLKSVALQLAKPFAHRRHEMNNHLPRSVNCHAGMRLPFCDLITEEQQPVDQLHF